MGCIIEYLKKYQGMKYTKYNLKTPIMGENEPFWVSNSKLPDFSYIYERGVLRVLD